MVVQGFLGNHRDENYKEIIENLFKNYYAVGVHMFLWIHFLYSHLDFCHENLDAVSDEQGERFSQDLKMIEERQGFWEKMYVRRLLLVSFKKNRRKKL